MARYNIALIPSNPEARAKFIAFSHLITKDCTPIYQLKTEGSIPHISLMQFVIADIHGTAGILTPKNAVLAEVWAKAQGIWQKTISRELRVSINAKIDTKHDRTGEYAGVTWVDSKVISHQVQELHDGIRIALESAQYRLGCKNASGMLFDPHVTWGSFDTEDYRENVASMLDVISDEYKDILDQPYQLVLGKANDYWELTEIMFEETCPSPKSTIELVPAV